MKKLKFVKPCPCIIDKKRRFFDKGDVKTVTDQHAAWMIDCGYAISYVRGDENLKQLDPINENKSSKKPIRKKRGKKAE